MPDSYLMSFLNTRTPPQIQQRGRDYVQRNRVGRVQNAGTAFFAPVKGVGGQIYMAEIEMGTPRAPEIHLSCSCPYFEQFGICKHVYALGLTLEKLGEEALPSTRSWRDLFSPRVLPSAVRAPSRSKAAPKAVSVLHYVLDPAEVSRDRPVRLYVMEEQALKSGRIKLKPVSLLQPSSFRVDPSELPRLALLQGMLLEQSNFSFYSARSHSVNLTKPSTVEVLEDLVSTGRLHFGNPLKVQDVLDLPVVGGAMAREWRIVLRGEKTGEGLTLHAGMVCGEEQMPLDDVRFVHDTGVMAFGNTLSRVVNPELFDWARELEAEAPGVPEDEVVDFVESLYELNVNLPAELPESVSFREIRQAPRFLLRILEVSESMDAWVQPEFAYGDRVLDWLDARDRWVVGAAREIHVRDRDAETEALKRLEALGAGVTAGSADGVFGVDGVYTAELLETLDREGWELLIRDTRLRTNGQAAIRVEGSGQDWFELEGELTFGDETMDLPEVLRSVKRKGRFLQLKNGSMALLSEALVERFTVLQGLGDMTAEEGTLTFSGAGAVFLDMLLADVPGVDWGAEAVGLRNRLRKLGSPEPAAPPAGFQGELRVYQQEGLGWMRYLRDMGLNGCLADDMGLGKTVQVLALLEEQRAAKRGPSLAVLPRSIVFNWRMEAAKFTPELRVAELSGVGRPKSASELPPADLYLITYQTLIRDVAWLRQVMFDYVILDESQAVKNPAAKTSKAVKLLTSRHRLTLTGTPVENRIEDLWSQLNFLNPGMLGRKFMEAKDLSDESLRMIARGVRPFLLRRTKEQVATDLPEKVEETLYCELPAPQRKLYTELKTYYQKALADGISEKGFQQSKIMVLEALLRLRQAACHPGLISEEHRGMESGKMGALDDLLEDILSSGHKALIFSQFTSMLALVRERLDRRKIAYVYLDGQTRDRNAVVNAFQDRPEIPLFLISLKAGGVGLNLTAADYVILLDPWWNPAIEAQAIDRAHRIGQEKNVFAYRVVAKDTIEDKILALQDDKRHLAESILTQENSLLSKLTPEDLTFLLS